MARYLDTRDLAKRLEELQDELTSLRGAVEDAETALSDYEPDESNPDAKDDLLNALREAESSLAEWREENDDELAELERLESEISGWRDGERLIPDSEFVEYCQHMLGDCGMISADISWVVVIDWDATADNLKVDFTEVEYQGKVYWTRC